MTDTRKLTGQDSKTQNGEEKYSVIFEGKINPNSLLQVVKQEIGALFGIDTARVEGIFAKTPWMLKSNLTLRDAQQYKMTFEQTGALCAIKGLAGKPVPPQAGPPAAAKTPQPPPGLTPPTVKPGAPQAGPPAAAKAPAPPPGLTPPTVKPGAPKAGPPAAAKAPAPPP
ncbi:MAG: hypothetical protein KAW12_22745, partial [Candidatus Aminicenantes bacterium]|nr:hypothetical protein [Candidatus Aminicenantes bacterium]